jgi:large conductance mechanosensitive channel
MLKEFKEFAVKGNMLDMAIGIIIGLAFGTIIASLVNDILMPPIGILLGNVDFSALFIVLKEGTPPPPYNTLPEAQNAGAVTWNYGNFINTIIIFLIVAFSVFLIVKSLNNMRRKKDEPQAAIEKDCPYCFTVIPIKASKCPNCTTPL